MIDRPVPRGSLLRIGVLVFCVAFLLRAGWGIVQHARGVDLANLEFPDEQQYWRMAQSLHGGEGLRDEFGFRATRMPLYPGALSLLAGVAQGVIWAKGVQWLVGAAGAVLMVHLGAGIGSRRTGLLSGLWGAIDPFAIFFSSLLLTETLYIVWILLLWCVALPLVRSPRTDSSPWGRYLILGVVGAGAVYTREAALGLVLAVLALTLLVRPPRRAALRAAALTCAVLLLALLPWALRNRQVTGAWCFLTNRSGISLYDGVGPQADGSSDLAAIQQMPAVHKLDEASWNRFFLDASWQSLREDPWRIVKLAGVKLRRTWNCFPNVETHQSTLARSVSAAFVVPTFVLALVGVGVMVKMGRGDGVRGALFLLLPVVYVSALHSLFVGSVRYRLVAMPMIEILAAMALAGVLARFCSSSARAGGRPEHAH